MLVRLPSGTRIEKTEDVIEAIEAVITDEIGAPDPEYPKVERHERSNLRMLISNIGVLMDWPAAYTPNTGPMDAFVLVQLKVKSGRPGTFEYVSRLRERLRAEFPGVEFAFDTGGMLTAALNLGEPAPIHVQVAGSHLEVSHEIGQVIAREISAVPGATDVRIAQRLDYPVVELEIDRSKAAEAGVSVDDIMKNLVTATNSSINFDPAFWIDHRNGNHYFIGAQYDEGDLESFEAFRNVPVTGRAGYPPVPLRTLVKERRATGPSVINHRNITRVIDVYASVLPGRRVGTVVRKIENRLAGSKELAPRRRSSERGEYYEIAGPEYEGKGYTFSVTGEARIMREAAAQFAFGFVIAIILIYLVMVAQFRSFRDPIVVLIAVPLGFIGVGSVLYLTGTAVNVASLMGILLMAGIVVAYSIILVDFANRRVGGGADVREAIVDASRVRLRPILMIAVTTVLAVLPMAFGFAGGEANVPLARAIIGGVTAAAFLTLFVVPCFYVLIKRAPEDGEGGEEPGAGES